MTAEPLSHQELRAAIAHSLAVSKHSRKVESIMELVEGYMLGVIGPDVTHQKDATHTCIYFKDEFHCDCGMTNQLILQARQRERGQADGK